MPAIVADAENAGIPPVTEAKPKSISLGVPRADIKTLAWTSDEVNATKDGEDMQVYAPLVDPRVSKENKA